MYKPFYVSILLLAILVLASASKFNDSDAAQAAQHVLRVDLTNQTVPIPQTTLFTPNEDGMYRISAYMVMTTSGYTPNAGWLFDLFWTDEAGVETRSSLIGVFDNAKPPSAYATNGNPGYYPTTSPFIFRAVAGQPVSYDVSQYNPPANGSYALHMVIERL